MFFRHQSLFIKCKVEAILVLQMLIKSLFQAEEFYGWQYLISRLNSHTQIAC